MCKKTGRFEDKIVPSKIKKLKGVPPYHLFKVMDNFFVFDTTGCRFYEIDELAYDFLTLLLIFPFDQAEKKLQFMNKYTSTEMLDIMQEISLLKNHGLFDTICNYINLRHAKKEIQNATISGMLYDAQLLLSETCNLACTYCYCPSNLPNGGIMKKGVAKKMIDLLLSQKKQYSCLTMFGGEPLLNKPLVNFIMEYSKEQMKIKSKKLHYIITTNATLLDDKMIDYIVNDNFGLMVSLDGPRELHNRQCPTKSGKGSYDMAVCNIKKLMKRRPVAVRATLAHPLPNIKYLVDFFVNFGFNNIVIGTASNRTESQRKSDLTKDDFKLLLKQQEELLPSIQKILEEGKTPKYFLYERWYSDIENAQINMCVHLFNCGAGTTVCGVNSIGSLYPCAKFCGMLNWQIGNAKEGINYEKVKNMWYNFLKCIKPKCGKCWAYPVCHGPCIWECAQNDGTFKFSKKYCDYVKKNIERSAYLYLSIQKSSDKKRDNTTSKPSCSCIE